MRSDFERQWIALSVVAEVVEHFDTHSTLGPLIHVDPHFGRVTFFRIPGRMILHVVGDDRAADECRHLLSDRGLRGWRLHPVPDGETPLVSVCEDIHRITGGDRVYNVLADAGFATIEELAATPIQALRELPNRGPDTTAHIEDILIWWHANFALTQGFLPAPVKAALAETAASLEGCGLLAVCGFPVSGKSTAAKYIADIAGATVLTQAGFAPELERVALAALGGAAGDRDSDLYRRVVAPALYEGLVRTGLRIAPKHPVVLDASFLPVIRHVTTKHLALADYLRGMADVPAAMPVVTVWMDSSPSDIRTRMTKRGTERDVSRLAGWDYFRTTMFSDHDRVIACAASDFIIIN
ncbi:AAA family ATPase [Nocardia sp. NPDC056000]|uniref:AAA family ATPase n=1 Tax=Nocardia sp. NPDC056000 TaxID=3345674 RepID=UPI0035E0A0B5